MVINIIRYRVQYRNDYRGVNHSPLYLNVFGSGCPIIGLAKCESPAAARITALLNLPEPIAKNRGNILPCSTVSARAAGDGKEFRHQAIGVSQSVGVAIYKAVLMIISYPGTVSKLSLSICFSSATRPLSNRGGVR